MLAVLAIFFAKVFEVTLSTLRLVYINKGAKVYAATIGFVEVLIWLKVASVVLVGISDDPSKMFAYALGFSAGSIVGMIIEDKIGLGYSRLEFITNSVNGEILAEEIRKLGKAVTITDATGKDGDKVILNTFLRRKTKEVVLDRVKELDIECVITISEIQKVYGGFGLK